MEKSGVPHGNALDFQGSHHHKLAIATNLIQKFKTDWQKNGTITKLLILKF